jgi:SAM-dependent methyltransferase
MNAVSDPRSDRNETQGMPPGDFSDRKTSRARGAEDRVIAANVEFYRRIADKYESYEPYLFDKVLQKGLQDDLDKIGSYFAPLGRAPSCLECGGGTGNLTLKMCARGWNVTVVDISEHMLNLLTEKAHTKGYSPTVVQCPIERFLEESEEKFDLVTFSSVLHHLYSYQSVVEQAALHVRFGGLFYSNWDPVIPRSKFWARGFDSIEIAAAKFMLDRGDVLPGIWRRTQKLFRRHDSQFLRPVVSAGDLAEYHAKTGVDDEQIVCLLERKGFAIVAHERYPVGRTRAGQILNRRLRLLENFKIIARHEE